MEFGPRTVIPKPAPSQSEVKAALEKISKAKNPIIIAGDSIIRSGAHEPLIQFGETMILPVVTSFCRHDAFPNQHP
jgi:acetolactate synthase-1/2/3 large subunit